MICPRCKKDFLVYVYPDNPYCDKCLTFYAWVAGIIVIPLSIILTAIMFLSLGGVINQWFTIIPISLFLIIPIFIILYKFTSLGKKLHNKYPNSFANPDNL